VSAILANDKLMSVFTPGTHGSTFGGNPFGARIAITALKVNIKQIFKQNLKKIFFRF
jgi:ornithine--oxo-acid transaminase